MVPVERIERSELHPPLAQVLGGVAKESAHVGSNLEWPEERRTESGSRNASADFI